MPIEEHNSNIPLTEPLADSAYIASLWEQPNLCLAFFGVQFYSEAGQRLYEESGIQEEMFPALEIAEGLLLNRPMITPEGPMVMQYWRSYSELGRWARQLPYLCYTQGKH